MKNVKEKLSGVFPPIMTPFIDQEVAYDKLADNIRKYNETGLTGYMPLGSNGEFRSLTEEESLKILDVVYKNKSKNKVLMAGTQRESAKATIEFTKKAADRGIEFASILCPHYFPKKMSEEALKRFFVEIADNSPVPILLYNSPGFSGGVVLSVDSVAYLSAHPNIVGMKDGTKENMSSYIKAITPGTEFYILAGTITKFYPGLLDGGVGGVLSMANYFPEFCVGLYELYLKKDIESGQKMHEKLCNYNEKTSGSFGVAGVKAAMDLVGFFGGDPRIPLLPITAEEKEGIKAFLIQERLIK